MTRKDHHRTSWLAVSLVACLGSAGPAGAADQQAPTRLELVCREQPMRAVSFGDPGQVSYGEQPPQEREPVTLTISKTEPGEDFHFDYASIEASRPYLAVDEAIWISGKQIEAQEGRFKLNLDNLVMTLTETDPDGSARFRRFACEEQGTPR